MENDLVEYLQDIGYTGPFQDVSHLQEALSDGLNSGKLKDLVVWLCHQISSLCDLDSTVSDVSSEDDNASFVMEIGSLLKELGCPYSDLTEGPLTERLASKDQFLRLLVFLASEVMSARMIRHDGSSASGPVVRLTESATARDLKNILLALRFGRPPDNISPKDLFAKVEAKLSEVLSKTPSEISGLPLLPGRLSADQWSTLKQVQEELNEEYRLRRDMLLKRLDVTIQSFEWSENAKGKENAIAGAYIEKRQKLTSSPMVSLADIIAARRDTAVIEKTSSASARKNTASELHKVIIGKVPDRGGRPDEQEPPPPEMPSWQKDRAAGGGGGRGGGFAPRGGGRVQGGWNNQPRRSGGGDRRGGRH